jgi:hypothetical protein
MRKKVFADSQQYRGIFSPHSCTVHLDTIKVLLPTAEQNNRFKRILKLTLEFIFKVNINILLKQLFCASVGNKTLITQVLVFVFFYK